MSAAPEQLRPFRLHGGRFETAEGVPFGFPIDAIAELARYERLLTKVARELWLYDNPERSRVPKGFEDGLRLRLTAVEDGSVQPVLARASPEPGVLFADPLIGRSQAEIARALDAVVIGDALPETFPSAALSSLVAFGISLRPDETCFVDRPGAQAVPYDQASRRHLVRIVSADDVKFDGDLVGQIGGLSANDRTFEFTERSGRRAAGSFEQVKTIDLFRPFVDRDAVAPFVRLTCRYSTTELGQLSRISEVEDVQLFVGGNDTLAEELRSLLQLRFGWDGQHAPPPSSTAIEWVRDAVAELTEDEARDLLAAPTHEGGVLLERHVDQRRWSMDVDPEGQAVVVSVEPDLATEMIEVTEPADATSSYRGFLGG